MKEVYPVKHILLNQSIIIITVTKDRKVYKIQ